MFPDVTSLGVCAKLRAGAPRVRLAHRGPELVVQLDRVAPHLPTSSDSQDLHVRFDRLQCADQSEKPGALALLAEPLIRGDVHRERGPAVVEPRGKHAVAVHELDRRLHLQRPGALSDRT